MTPQPGPAKEIWLFLVREGDWLKAGEIRKALPQLASANVHATLEDMVEGNTVSARKGSGQRNLYAVTHTNRVTRGVTVKEMLEAVGTEGKSKQ